MRRRRFALAVLNGCLLVGGTVGLAAAPAAADPATVTSFPAGAVSTTYAGRAFDTCSAPSFGAIQQWSASPYRAVAVYIGGINRACGQPNLSSSWVTSVARSGWRLIPVYVGRQAPCVDRSGLVEISPTTARTQGTLEASDAALRARAVGLRAGSAIYSDIENYSTTDASCRVSVLQYLSGWTRELHRQGFLSGVYSNTGSGITHLSAVHGSTSYARPDAVWAARWDGLELLTGWPGVSSSYWTVHQRGKQYQGDHTETWAGVSIQIDSNRFDGPVGSVALPYQVTAAGGLNARSGPGTTYPVVTVYPSAAGLSVICQTTGSTVGTTTVWDRLSDGSYVTDYFVSTPSQTTYSAPVPRCRYPYQVAASPSLKKHTAASTTSPSPGSLLDGALAWVTCQAPGGRVGTTSVWDRLDDGTYVSDYYVSTLSNTTYTSPLPRC